MKKIITALLALTLIFSLAACTNSDGGMNNNSENGGMNDNTESIMPDDNMLGSSTPLNGNNDAQGKVQAKLSYDDAKNAALKDAALNSKDVQFIRCELDRDDGILKYEVEFKKDGVEYEYDINADTGEILWVDKDYD